MENRKEIQIIDSHLEFHQMEYRKETINYNNLLIVLHFEVQLTCTATVIVVFAAFCVIYVYHKSSKNNITGYSIKFNI